MLSDRYADSTIAYQGYGHQQDLAQVRSLVQYATGGLVPDLTVLLDVDVEVGLERSQERRARGGEWNRLDAYRSISTAACAPGTWKWSSRNRGAGSWWTPASPGRQCRKTCGP